MKQNTVSEWINRIMDPIFFQKREEAELQRKLEERRVSFNLATGSYTFS